jgi:hypothetical protein
MPDASLPVEASKVANSGSVFHSSLPSGNVYAGYDVEQALRSTFVNERGAVMDFCSRRAHGPHNRRTDPRARRQTTGTKSELRAAGYWDKNHCAAPRTIAWHGTTALRPFAV